MNPLPHHTIGEFVVIDGQRCVITDRAPHAEGWRYTFHRSDLAGPEGHVTEDDTHPITGLTPSARPLLSLAGLNPDHFDEEQAAITQAESAKRVRRIRAEETLHEAIGDWHHGRLSDAEMHQTYIEYAEKP